MESPSDSYPPPPKPDMPERSFFREWRDFAIGLALLAAVIVGYIWIAESNLPSTSLDQPEPEAGFPASTSASSAGTIPTALNEQGGTP